MDKNEILELIDEECGEDMINPIKAEAAWALGIEEGSDEWEELMDI